MCNLIGVLQTSFCHPTFKFQRDEECLLACNSVESGRSSPIFCRKLLAPSSGTEFNEYLVFLIRDIYNNFITLHNLQITTVQIKTFWSKNEPSKQQPGSIDVSEEHTAPSSGLKDKPSGKQRRTSAWKHSVSFQKTLVTFVRVAGARTSNAATLKLVFT